jgi:hypothetical protein
MNDLRHEWLEALLMPSTFVSPKEPLAKRVWGKAKAIAGMEEVDLWIK